MINPLDYPIFLSRPLRVVKPHWWLQHVPFAMLLVDLLRPKLLVELGTHTGTSYSAFCQAVKELSLDTQCYAVDNWQGDPHEGYYGDDVLRNLKAFHDPLYGRFSKLVQTTFDDAVHHFDDKSIDLLHIDGYHTYDAVKHDFETWLPKMSHRGIVLIHDISVYQEDFGVWKYWSELKEQYLTFEFVHGMGLGIVFVGTEPVGEISKLFSMSEDQITRFQNFFFDFGLKVSTIVEKEEQLQDFYAEQGLPTIGKERVVQSLAALVAEKEQIVRSLTPLIAEKEHIVQSLKAKVTEQEQKAAEQEQKLGLLSMEVAKREQELVEITNSKSWKFAMLLRRTRVVLAPANSWRTTVLRQLIKVIIFPFKIVKKNRLVHFLRSEREKGSVTQPAQQFQVSSGTIDMTENKKTNNIAVILHLFYEDLFEEIKNYLQHLEHFDLYISMPESNHHLEDQIFVSFPDAKVFYTENRGRDIYPFISIYKNIRSLNYEYLLKIHTKKSPHREDGDIWRTDIYEKLMGSTEVINSVLSSFENDQTIGIIGPKGHVIDYRVYWGGNKPKTKELAKRVGISLTEYRSFRFVAGSMFWAKPEALRYLSLVPIEYKEFEPEPVGPDGAFVHALERFIGLTVEETGYSIYESDLQGNISDPRKGPPNASYPFGEPNDTYIAESEKLARPQKSDNNSINRLTRFFRNVRSLGKLIYKNPEKAVGIGIELIRNPRNPKITQKIIQSIRGIAQSNSLSPDSKETGKAIPLVIPEKVPLTEHLAENLLKCLANKQYVISISHSEYMQVVGGVEIMMMDEQKAYNKNGLVYLHIFPFLMPHPRLISEDEPLYIGVNCDGERIGITDREGLLLALGQLNSAGLLNIIIHHTMGFDLAFLGRLLKEVGKQKGRFWLHDNFSICPGYTLLRNDLVYCGAPDVNSNACLICKYGKTRAVQQPAFIKLFNDNDLEIVSPSRFTLDLWKKNFPFARISETVAPHLNLDWKGTLPSRQSKDPIRIGFLGYPVYWKGWKTWMRLATKFYGDPRYKFYCFTSWSKVSNKMKWVRVSVSKNDRLSMVKTLRDHKIDVAFLWSLCPETFSFTLYESLAAGCYALTYKDSGNIQDYLNQNTNRGLVLNDEQALFELFSSDDLNSLVAHYQQNGRPQGEFSFLPEFDH